MQGKSTVILGVSAGHDASATVLVDGSVRSHILRERHTGVKHHYGIDRRTIEQALADAGVAIADVDGVALTATQIIPSLIDDADFLNFAVESEAGADAFFRETATRGAGNATWAGEFLADLTDSWRIPANAHGDWFAFRHVSPLRGPDGWLDRYGLHDISVRIPQFIKAGALDATMHVNLAVTLGGRRLPGIFVNHHLCHAASTFSASPFSDAVIVTHDGGFNVDSGFIFLARNGKLYPIGPHYVVCGQFYDHVGAELDFDDNGAAGKLMGLAGYGKGKLDRVLPVGNQWDWYTWADKQEPDWVKDRRIFDVMNRALRKEAAKLGVAPEEKFNRKIYPTEAAGEIAWLAQDLVERTMVELVRQVRQGLDAALPDCPDNLCLSGGVALNCPTNTKIHDTGLFKALSIEPHCDDGGISLGAAHYLATQFMGAAPPRRQRPATSAYAMQGERHDIIRTLKECAARDSGIVVEPLSDWPRAAAELLAADKIIALHQGRSELGPRALGHRSVLANPGPFANWRRVNDVKGREHWRPFAPAMLAHRLRDWFTEGPEASPFMLFTYACRPEKQTEIAAVIHHDGTSRVQTVEAPDGPLFDVISAFEALTGLPIVMNTSFNGPGQPIIEKVETALQFLKDTAIDAMFFANEGAGRAGYIARRA